MPVIAYVAPEACPNSKRFAELVQANPSKVRLVDVTRVPPPASLTHVPTVVLETGQSLVGFRAFEWANQNLTTDAGGEDLNDNLAAF